MGNLNCSKRKKCQISLLTYLSMSLPENGDASGARITRRPHLSPSRISSRNTWLPSNPLKELKSRELSAVLATTSRSSLLSQLTSSVHGRLPNSRQRKNSLPLLQLSQASLKLRLRPTL